MQYFCGILFWIKAKNQINSRRDIQKNYKEATTVFALKYGLEHRTLDTTAWSLTMFK